MKGISPQEVVEIMAEHVPDERGYACTSCEGPWPCDKRRLASRIEDLETSLEFILREHYKVLNGQHEACCTCSPQDSDWPCVTVLEARAALGGMG